MNVGNRSKSLKHRRSFLEALEPRTLFSVSASAQLNLVSTTGTMSSPVYHYDITVTDTGTTNIGTFWFAWLPGQDFLPSAPLTESSPTGWGSAVTGSGNSTDGSAIQWVASSGAITPGNSLSGFAFTSPDSPTALAGNSPDYPSTAVMTTEVYSAGPFSDAGFVLTVAPAVTLAASTTSVTASQPTINVGSPVTLTATVASAGGSGAVPTGSVSFFEGGNSIGSAPLQNGSAALTTSALPSGSLSITAQYGGDSTYSGSTSAAITETVNAGAAATLTTLMTSAASIHVGDSISLTATVAPVAAGSALPTGNVIFTDNGSSLGTVQLNGQGTATLATSALPVGSDTIVATYAGDTTFAGSDSPSVTETVAPAPTLVPQIVKSTIPTALVASAAAHGNVSLQITNTTSAAIKGKLTLEVFASTDGTIDNSAIELTQVQRTFNVKTTKPATTSLPVKILPSQLPAGSYTLLARVIDLQGNNNDSSSGGTLTVAAPFIALSESFTKMTIPSSTLAGTKVNATVALLITNNGNITTPSSTTVALYASATGVVDGNATQITSVTKPLHIRPGKTAMVMMHVKEIPAIAPGAYTIIAQVIDPNGQTTFATGGTVTIIVT